MTAAHDFPYPRPLPNQPELMHAAYATFLAACDEIDRLRAWKAEALVVLAEWDEVWVAAGKPGPLGTSKAAGLQRLLPDLDHLRRAAEACRNANTDAWFQWVPAYLDTLSTPTVDDSRR